MVQGFIPRFFGKHRYSLREGSLQRAWVHPRIFWLVGLCNRDAQRSLDAEGAIRHEVEKELTGQETEPWEIIYFSCTKARFLSLSRHSKQRRYCSEVIKRVATVWR